MTPDVETMLRDLESIKADARSVCAGLSDPQFNWRPEPGRWSIAECLVHLNVSITVTLPAFDAAIAQGLAQGAQGRGTGPFRYGWLSRWIVRSMEPPPRFKMRTFHILQPPAGATHRLAPVLPDFLALRDELAERLRRSDGLDLRGVRAISPVNRLMRLPLGAYFQFILAHDRRHLWQARQMLAASGFPRA